MGEERRGVESPHPRLPWPLQQGLGPSPLPQEEEGSPDQWGEDDWLGKKHHPASPPLPAALPDFPSPLEAPPVGWGPVPSLGVGGSTSDS